MSDKEGHRASIDELAEATSYFDKHGPPANGATGGSSEAQVSPVKCPYCENGCARCKDLHAISGDERELWEKGNFIEALRQYRQRVGVGLKLARDKFHRELGDVHAINAGIMMAEPSAQALEDLPASALAMCHARGWSLHWTHRGAYLHLESSELIEAIRGKGGDPTKEAADVLIVLMTITEHAGICWYDVLKEAAQKINAKMGVSDQ